MASDHLIREGRLLGTRAAASFVLSYPHVTVVKSPRQGEEPQCAANGDLTR